MDETLYCFGMTSHKFGTTAAVEDWWNSNPFAFGVSNTDGDQVGTVALAQMDKVYFSEVERRFRKHHNGAAQDEGLPLFSKVIDRTWLKDKDVLDIAVGSGFSAVSFAEAGARVTGIDLTDFGVAHAQKNFEVRGLSGTVLKMDAQKMTFSDNSFDFVNAWGCLMHMPDTEGAIKEMYRVLRPHGRVLAYMYNKRSWPYWFNIILVRGILMLGLVRFGGDTVRLTSRYSDGYTRGGNMLTKFYNPREVQMMFEAAGFVNVVSKPWEIPHEPNHWPMRSVPFFKYLPVFIKRQLTRFGYGLIITAEKK